MIGQSIWLAVISNGTKWFCRCHGNRFTLESQLFCNSHKCAHTPPNSHTRGVQVRACVQNKKLFVRIFFLCKQNPKVSSVCNKIQLKCSAQMSTSYDDTSHLDVCAAGLLTVEIFMRLIVLTAAATATTTITTACHCRHHHHLSSEKMQFS